MKAKELINSSKGRKITIQSNIAQKNNIGNLIFIKRVFLLLCFRYFVKLLNPCHIQHSFLDQLLFLPTVKASQ